jgi:uncharacterized protein (TIGR00369 family)
MGPPWTHRASKPADPAFAERVRASFAAGRDGHHRRHAGRVAPGRVVIELPWQQALTQQHGFLHAGMVGTALDSACGYAGSTLMPADAGVLTIEYKINLLAPAQGERFRMEGLVVKPGRTITWPKAAPTPSTTAARSWSPP